VWWGKTGEIKTLSGSTLQLLNPLIILDEGHKAYRENARKTLEEFNP
jgi:type III restriction enzyme